MFMYANYQRILIKQTILFIKHQTNFQFIYEFFIVFDIEKCVKFIYF